MDVQINWLAVVLATVSSMVIGAIWYAPGVFGNTWMGLIGKSKKDLEKAGWWPMAIALVVSFVTAYVLAHVSYLSNSFFQNSFLQDSLTTAFWMWLGFTATRIITHDSFEGRPRKLTLMAISYELLTFLTMGLIIGLIKP